VLAQASNNMIVMLEVIRARRACVRQAFQPDSFGMKCGQLLVAESTNP
jgi:hypothetical protein